MTFSNLCFLVCLLFGVVNGQQLWQNPQCRKQLLTFSDCMKNQFVWKEREEIVNRSREAYMECNLKHGCIPKFEDLPHDFDWRKRKCAADTAEAIKQKVVACVRLRVSSDFELPENRDWAYGRYSYESVPLAVSPLESECKRGDMEGARKCYMESDKRMGLNMTEEERIAYFEKGCSRRAECFKLLDDECLAKYDAYRQSFCECAFDVHEMYGGKRLLMLIPSCAGLINDKKSRYVQEYKQRDSCALSDLNERDSMNVICDIGYERFLKKNREKMANMSTTAAPKATNAPVVVSDKAVAN